MKPRLLVCAALGCAMLAGCTDSGSGGSSADAASASEASSRSGEASAAASLVVMVDGVRLDDDSNNVAFGTPRAAAVETMTGLLDEPSETGDNNECGAGPMQFVHYGNFTLNFQDDRLVGWSVFDGEEPAGLPIATPAGLTIGSSRAEVDAAPQAVFEETSIGLEFTADGVDGVVDQDGPDGVVTNLWAGTNCIFR